MIAEKGQERLAAISTPNYFRDAALAQGTKYYDYQDETNFHWENGSQYACIKKIGQGRYSQVFQAIYLPNSMKCVVKMLKPVSLKKVLREAKILMVLNGQENVIKLLDLVKEGNIYCLVMEFAPSFSFGCLSEKMSPVCCKKYLYQILKSLHYCHSRGVMHRDINPNNLAFSPENVKVLDWGLAEFYIPMKKYSPKVGTRSFKAPELLLGYQYYHYSVDIWAVAVLMAGMIFKKQPFFRSADDEVILEQITRVLGSESLHNYKQKYQIQLPHENKMGMYQGLTLSGLVHSNNRHLATPAAIGLLETMLVFDHVIVDNMQNMRPSAFQCMQHSFFDEVREDVDIVI